MEINTTVCKYENMKKQNIQTIYSHIEKYIH